MSIDIKYDSDVGVIFTLQDEFSFSEVEHACKQLFASERFKKIKYWVVDRSKSIKYNLTTPQTKILASLCISASNKNKSLTHILVSGSDHEYGMAHMFQVFEDKTEWNLLSFKKIESVHQWVNDNVHP